jgi:hypothetical protein
MASRVGETTSTVRVKLRNDLLKTFHENNSYSLSQVLNQLLERHLSAKGKSNDARN